MWRLGLLLVCACGRIGFDPTATAPDAGPDDAHSRLAHIRYVFDDGTSLPFGIFDRQRNEACTIKQVPGGGFACLPAGLGVVYADAACTQPLAIASTCEPLVSYVALFQADGERLFDRGPVSAATQYYSGASCLGPFSPNGSTLYDLGAELPVSLFVSLPVVPTPTTARLEARQYVADDGFRAPATLYDRDLAAECDPQVFSDGSSACLPSLSAFTSNYFADAACAQPLAVATTASVSFGFSFAASSCSASGYTLYRLGTEDPGTIYLNIPPCSPTSHPTMTHFFPLGEQLTLATVPTTVRQGSRIDVTEAIVDGVVFASLTPYDRQLAAPCSVSLAGDGALRCVPNAPATVMRFVDAGCTQQATLGPAPFQGCPQSTAPFAKANRIVDACTVVSDIYPVTSAHVAAVYQIAGSCTVDTQSWDDLGPLVDPTTLVGVTQVTDPML